MVRRIAFSVFVILSLALQPKALAQDEYLMITLGDSITAASLAETRANDPRQDGLPWFNLDKLEWWMNLFSQYSNKETLSWASGESVKSHFVRLREYMSHTDPKAKLSVINTAIPGARSLGLESQVKSALHEYYSKDYLAVKYITLMIGPNDLCWAGTPVPKIVKSVKQTLESLSTIVQDEPVRVMIAGLPMLPNLGKQEVLSGTGVGGFRCNTILNRVLNWCSKYTGWHDEKTYNELAERIVKINEYFRDTAAQVAAQNRNMSVAFSDAFTQFSITSQDLAADCFHPNASAHERLAEILWNDQPWFH